MKYSWLKVLKVYGRGLVSMSDDAWILYAVWTLGGLLTGMILVGVIMWGVAEWDERKWRKRMEEIQREGLDRV